MTDAIPIRLACLDMAGTTVADEGAVMSAFARAMDRIGIAEGTAERERAEQYTAETMGQSKIEVFRVVAGGRERAEEANEAFEAAYLDLVRGGAVRPIAGASETIARLREFGIRVALTTGFSEATRTALIDALGWQEVADLALSPADAGRGRPYPDMILTALLRCGTDDVRAVAVAGDTASDVVSGRRAGAAIVAGVLTGSHGGAELTAAGATHLLGSVAELPRAIGL